MFYNTHEDCIEISDELIKKYNLEDMLFFDIESTGFNKSENFIVMISIGYYTESTFKIIQGFVEKQEEEKELLEKFIPIFNRYDIWVSFNGIAFDEVFIRYKAEEYNLRMNYPNQHIDLYRLIRPYYKSLGIKNCNLKGLENYIGINRKDKIEGKKIISLYEDYTKYRNSSVKDIIMLHNYEDVLYLPYIFNILKKIEDNNIKRDDLLSHRQLKRLNYLIKINNIVVKEDISNISKKAADRIISFICKGNRDEKEIVNIIKNSY